MVAYFIGIGPKEVKTADGCEIAQYFQSIVDEMGNAQRFAEFGFTLSLPAEMDTISTDAGAVEAARNLRSVEVDRRTIGMVRPARRACSRRGASLSLRRRG